VKHLAVSLLLDARLQARNKLYAIGIGLALAIGVGARQFFSPDAAAALLPGVWLGAVGNTTFLFVAGMLLLEKGERTLDAIIVTPLRLPTYLASKVLTLSGFAAVESIIVLLLVHGPGVDPLALGLGLLLLGAQYTLASIAQVVTCDSVNDFVIPFGAITMALLQLPSLDAFGIWSHPALYLVPTEAAVVLMRGGFRPLASWEWGYALGYGGLSLAALAWLAHARFVRHVVHRGGRP
jgi:fluoroquinolone transport system permease protein